MNGVDPVYVSSNARFINICDPRHDTVATTAKIYGNGTDNEADMGGFVSYQHMFPNYCDVMEGKYLYIYVS